MQHQTDPQFEISIKAQVTLKQSNRTAQPIRKHALKSFVLIHHHTYTIMTFPLLGLQSKMHPDSCLGFIHMTKCHFRK